MTELPKQYNFLEKEKEIYELWEKSGFFNPDNLPDERKEAFCLIMPPPNVTGILHAGHALALTIEDIIVRYQRMKGKKTLFLPGTDHAAIATQSKVEKEIYKKEKKNRYDLGREELLKRISDFVKDSHATITSQIKTMGASCDWSREAFTLDEKRSLAVKTVFKKMYDDGLIYRGYRIVNWDPKGQTTISDDEIVYEERDAQMYTFKYSADFPISISTTRPETKIGDTAVAVHPDDERYKKYIGQEYDVVFCGVPLRIKIISDTAVEKDFGTGALGVTPAHSMIDWEMAQKNGLPVIPVIDERARMILGDENIKGKKTTEARETIVEWLKKEGLLEKEETIKQNVSTAERTGGIIEPLQKIQWFVAVNKPFKIEKSEIKGIEPNQETTLKEIMKKAVENGQTKIIPDYFSKTYFHWIDKLNDWCVSRQIWYGHQIPVWYKEDSVYCGVEPPQGDGWQQDEDTLDTWFSSALWTFSTLGWPEETNDLKFFHPTDVLETGYEILFFWVARMIMMSGYILGDTPFHTVYFHGTVRDGQGRKMSKSLGNGIDPIDVAKEFGIDAFRMSLIVGNTPGIDIKIDKNKIKGYRNFTTKIWNASRFVLMNLEDFSAQDEPASGWELSGADKKTLTEFEGIKKEITEDINDFRLYGAAEKIYHYFWHTFADKIIEDSKLRLNGENLPDKQACQYLLLKILGDCLKILHPFTPFITEEIWQHLPSLDGKEKKLLIVEDWPI